MYVVPQPYKCERCGFSSEYSPHESWPAPVFGREETRNGWDVTIDEPVCPKCYEAFVRANCGVMKPNLPAAQKAETNNG